MITIILQGIMMGIVLCLMVGPIFFQLIQITIESNPRTALIYVAGAWLSDLLCILLVIFAWSKLSELEAEYHYITGWITGLMLFALGVVSFFKKVEIQEVNRINSTSKNTFYFATGFLINTLNPLATLYWLGIASNMNAMNIHGTPNILLFFACIWLTLIASDFVKIAFAKKLKTTLRAEKLMLLNKILGLTLVCCAMILLWRLRN
jgi:threonine/homoserine/homoserine lactone efflux protein